MPHHPFTSFVNSKNDLPGLLAYALYKADKLEVCRAHPDLDLRGFVLSARLPARVSAYRIHAERMLEDMSREALELAYDAAEHNYRNRLQAFERALGFWPGLWCNVLASLIATAISVGIVVLAFGSKLNFWAGLMTYLTE